MINKTKNSTCLTLNANYVYINRLVMCLSLTLFLIALLSMLQIGGPNYTVKAVNTSFDYEEVEDEVFLHTSNNQTVVLKFREDGVVVVDSYLYDNPDNISEILMFTRYFATKQGYEIPRSDRALIGEYRLHTILFNMGYKQEQTGTLNWDYENDSRWYVNVTSSILGWLGV